MRLVHLDIDRFDAHNSIHLGPLAAGLNAVCGPQSSGKTTISRFVRAMMYPSESASLDRLPDEDRKSKGSMAWVDQAGVHRTYSHNSPDEPSNTTTPYHGYWADRTAYVGSEHRAWDNIPVDAFDAIYSGRLGEISIDRLWNAAKRIGVQGHSFAQEDLAYDWSESYRDSSSNSEQGKLYWQNERQRLLSRLADLDIAYSHRTSHTTIHSGPVQQRLDSVRAEISSLRSRESELVHALAVEPRVSFHSTINVETSHTRNVEQFDRQLLRWRQTLEEIRSQREQLERTTHDIELDLRAGHNHRFSPAIRKSLEKLEEQVVSARQQLTEENLRRDAHLYTHPVDQSLPFTLRKLQEDLYHVADQLSRRDSQSALEMLASHVAQLKRCEAELARSIDQQFQDHYRPAPYVTFESTRSNGSQSYDQLHSELIRIRARLSDAQEECCRLENDVRVPTVANSHRIDLAAERAEVLRQLQEVETTLSELNRDPRFVRKSRTVSNRETLEGTLIPRADRYLRDLTGGSLQRLPAWAMTKGTVRNSIGCAVCSPHIEHNLIRNSSHEERQLVELALRLAIIESARESHVCDLPLILDNAFESYDGELLDRVIHVLDQFAQRGHQVILLTRDELVAGRVQATHGCVCQLRPYQTLNPVRYARQSVAEQVVARRAAPVSRDESEINRRLLALANEYEALRYPTNEPRRRASVRIPKTPTQFCLALASPIDEAPSMTPPLIAVLKRHGIFEVGQLMETEPAHLVSILVDLGVRIEDIQRLQSECDLMCHVPQLRAFDARVLVGCGINSPKMLRVTPPNDLVARVDSFLSTPRGRDILRTASRSELSKLSNWLASAGRNRTKVLQSSTASDFVDHRNNRDDYRTSDRDFAREGNRQRDRQTDRTTQSRESLSQFDYDRNRNNGSASSSRSGSTKSSSSRAPRSTESTSRKKKRSARSSNVVRMQTQSVAQSSSGSVRFYLDLERAIVDAPSIGDSMAERLGAIGIRTVQHLLVADAADVAVRLNMPRVTATDILQWQQQATLVCRVPNLRGHDAQLLVAANVTSAEQLSQANASELLADVSKIASSKLGQRILRNSRAPDLAEVTDWITWSKSSRIIRAA
jgi:Domain of unknown function (DUF4332)